MSVWGDLRFKAPWRIKNVLQLESMPATASLSLFSIPRQARVAFNALKCTCRCVWLSYNAKFRHYDSWQISMGVPIYRQCFRKCRWESTRNFILRRVIKARTVTIETLSDSLLIIAVSLELFYVPQKKFLLLYSKSIKYYDAYVSGLMSSNDRNRILNFPLLNYILRVKSESRIEIIYLIIVLQSLCRA